MGVLMINDEPVGTTSDAKHTPFNPSGTDLTATNVEDAIKEVNESGGSGGHTIIDSTGTAVTQRTNLQFGKSVITDDPTNDITKINVNNAIQKTYAQYQALPSAEKTDGSVYYIPDYPGVGGVFFFQTVAGMNAAIAGGLIPNNAICVVEEDTPYVVNAEDVNYDNTESGLSATDLQNAVDELNSIFGTKIKTNTRIALVGLSEKYTIIQQSIFIESYYIIRNGFVFVSLNVDCVTPSSGNEKVCTIPQCDQMTTFTPSCAYYPDNPSDFIGVIVQSGNIYLNHGTAGNRYSVSFMYPIANY